MLYVLPARFMRVRYYGAFANCHRAKNLERCRVLLDAPLEEPSSEAAVETWQERLERLTGVDPGPCPDCGQGGW